jgi:ABC-type sugar transport system ATPase subunit
MPVEALKAEGIYKSYDGVHALRGAEFSLLSGEVHALMGENGAGKSTLGKIMAGVLRPDKGQITVEGKPVAINGPLDAQRLGISIIHQELDLFPNLSVAENIVIGNEEFTERGVVRFGEVYDFAEEFLQQAGLTAAPSRRVASLSIGEMQLVMIARALSMRARIIIMDEPTSSLFHDSVERLFELIRKLKAQNVAIVYVSHKMDEIIRISDRITVMRDAVTIGTRSANETSPPELIGMMVGRAWQTGDRKRRTATEEKLLTVSGLMTRKLKDVSFEVRKGEVVGIAGLVGAGRSELGAALMGLDRCKQGTMTLRGEPVTADSVETAFRHGMRLLPEDRKLDGLMMQMSILENGTIADLPKYAAGGFTRPEEEERAIGPTFRKLALKFSSLEAPVSSLSGGGQQKVLFARCLVGNPDVLFLDDPTRGIDLGAKEDIYAIIEQLAEQGKGIIFVSSELPELLRCCDRILVMREGQITADLEAGKTTQEEIMSFATNPVASAGEQAWPN